MMTDEGTQRDDADTPLIGYVKWFDPAKFLGFVVVQGYQQDFLLHRSTLLNFGRSSICADTRIAFEYESTENGYRVSRIVRLWAVEDTDEYDVGSGISEQGFVPARVKWFDQKKGYGFVRAHGSAEDIFIGMNALVRASLSDLRMGEAISVRLAETNGEKNVSDIRDWSIPPSIE